jgi:putative membrane protein
LFGDPVGLWLKSLFHPGGLLAVPTEPAEVVSESSRVFWHQTFALSGSVTLRVLPKVFVFGLVSVGVCALARLVEAMYRVKLGVDADPYGVAGAILALLLVLRTNAGYDLWWGGRKLWGGIVNQSRNLAIHALAYGPDDRAWREEFVRWVAAFPLAARASLRGEPLPCEVEGLIGEEAAGLVAGADHMPGLVALKLGALLHEACEQRGMGNFAFQQADRERAMLMDHHGACERIVQTPMPLVYSIKIRQFITLFLLALPFALLGTFGTALLVPPVTVLIAYPILSLDQTGIELENPFSTRNLSHLPLERIAATIERNLEGLLDAGRAIAAADRAAG